MFLTIPTMLNGQSKHYWEFNFAPTLSYRLLDDYDIDIGHKMALRHDLGINYGYAITTKFNLFSGIGFSRMGYDFRISYGAASEAADYIYYRNFLEFPIYLKYNFREVGKNSFFVDAGFVNQFYIREEGKVKQDSYKYLEFKHTHTDIKKKGFETYNLAILIGLTYHRALSDHFYLSLNPFYKYGILSLDNVHDFSIGLKVGMGVKY